GTDGWGGAQASKSQRGAPAAWLPGACAEEIPAFGEASVAGCCGETSEAGCFEEASAEGCGDASTVGCFASAAGGCVRVMAVAASIMKRFQIAAGSVPPVTRFIGV